MSEPAPESSGDLAKDLRGFGLLGLVVIVAILSGNFLFRPLSAILILLWAGFSHTPWRKLGFVQPRSWARVIFFGVLFGVALKFLMKAIVMPLLGADPINQAYHFLVGNRAALPQMIYLMIVAAGFGEELLFRGWLFERIEKLFGESGSTKVLIVLLTAAFFGIVHYPDQGVPGMEQATMVGLIYGTIFAIRRKIFFLMIAHAAFDLTALWMIYNDLESKVAHLIFR